MRLWTNPVVIRKVKRNKTLIIKTALDSCIWVGLISSLFTCWLCIPLSIGIKPNGNIYTIDQSWIVRRPILCTINFKYRLVHQQIILLNKLLDIDLCNKAVVTSHERLIHTDAVTPWSVHMQDAQSARLIAWKISYMIKESPNRLCGCKTRLLGSSNVLIVGASEARGFILSFTRELYLLTRRASRREILNWRARSSI